MNKNQSPSTIFGLDVQALAVALAPILAVELAKHLPEADRKVAREQGQVLSCNGAHRMARCKKSLVSSALQSGALKGKRIGNRWYTTVGDVVAWVHEGRPMTRSVSLIEQDYPAMPDIIDEQGTELPK